MIKFYTRQCSAHIAFLIFQHVLLRGSNCLSQDMITLLILQITLILVDAKISYCVTISKSQQNLLLFVLCVGYQKYSAKELLTIIVAKIGYVCLIKDYLYLYIVAMVTVLLLSPLDFMLSLVQHQFTNIDAIVYLVVTFIDV